MKLVSLSICTQKFFWFEWNSVATGQYAVWSFDEVLRFRSWPIFKVSSLPPFAMRAGKWLVNLKQGHRFWIWLGETFDIWPNFYVTRLWTSLVCNVEKLIQRSQLPSHIGSFILLLYLRDIKSIIVWACGLLCCGCVIKCWHFCIFVFFWL